MIRDIHLWIRIKLLKAWLRIRYAWLTFLIWGARNRLREIEAQEFLEVQDCWHETRKRFRASMRDRDDFPPTV